MMSRSDIPKNNWVDRYMPEFSRPYIRLARLDRPIGTWLLLLPCWWSLALGWKLQIDNTGLNELGYLYILFTLGALIMRGAGCTINDLWDRKMDKLVARTADRPIASGEISVKKAVLFLSTLFVLAALILYQLNKVCWLLGVLVLFLVFTYPFFKRITYWPQFILGLTFNWGALMGWAAITGSISFEPLLLYLVGIFWTLGYDTIYAHQDKEDDALVGVKSTAILFADSTKSWLFIFATLAAGLMILSFLFSISGLQMFIAITGALFFYLHMVRQVINLDIQNGQSLLHSFRSNRNAGLIPVIFLSISILF